MRPGRLPNKDQKRVSDRRLSTKANKRQQLIGWKEPMTKAEAKIWTVEEKKENPEKSCWKIWMKKKEEEEAINK